MFSHTRFENDSISIRTIEEMQLYSKLRKIHDDLQKLEIETGYPFRYVNNNNQRIFGPPPNHLEPPGHGSEVFVSRLPKDAYENEIFRFFTKVGRIYTIRTMITPSHIHNRGFAFVTFFTREEAQNCIRILRNTEFRKDCYLAIEKSLDNNRIFIGGIPDFKTKNEVWRELLKNGMVGITDILMYRSYADRNKNRGFVFVEFRSHQDAAQMRVLFKDLLLWGERMHVDWSSPLPEVEPRVMSQVKKLFLRNLEVSQRKSDVEKILKTVLRGIALERVYKFKDYAFVHFATRRDAQKGLSLLKELYKNTEVEVTWAIPPKYKPRHISRTSRSYINVESQLNDEAACTALSTPPPSTWEDALKTTEIQQFQKRQVFYNNEEYENITKMMQHLGIDK